MKITSLPNIKTTGVLCEGQLVKLGWPEKWEYDAITALRNEQYIRKWFSDNRPLDLQKNREWLESGMRRPYESVLSIRWKEDDSLLGTIGWSDWNMEKATAWFGRIAVKKNALKRIIEKTPLKYVGVAVDAAIAMRDFAFTTMKLNTIFTYYFANNKLAAHVNETIGLIKTDCITRKNINNIDIETVEMKMTKNDFMNFITEI